MYYVECKTKNSYENVITLFLSMLIKKLSFQSKLNYNVLLWIQGQVFLFLQSEEKKYYAYISDFLNRPITLECWLASDSFKNKTVRICKVPFLNIVDIFKVQNAIILIELLPVAKWLRA